MHAISGAPLHHFGRLPFVQSVSAALRRSSVTAEEAQWQRAEEPEAVGVVGKPGFTASVLRSSAPTAGCRNAPRNVRFEVTDVSRLSRGLLPCGVSQLPAHATTTRACGRPPASTLVCPAQALEHMGVRAGSGSYGEQVCSGSWL